MDDHHTAQDAVVMIYTTWPDAAAAERAGRKLVQSRLAACVNILAPATAIYAWEGKVEQSTEVPMLIKTMVSRVDDVRAAVRQVHEYDTPAFVVLEASDGDPAFSDWVRQQTT